MQKATVTAARTSRYVLGLRASRMDTSGYLVQDGSSSSLACSVAAAASSPSFFEVKCYKAFPFGRHFTFSFSARYLSSPFSRALQKSAKLITARSKCLNCPTRNAAMLTMLASAKVCAVLVLVFTSPSPSPSSSPVVKSQLANHAPQTCEK